MLQKTTGTCHIDVPQSNEANIIYSSIGVWDCASIFWWADQCRQLYTKIIRMASSVFNDEQV